MANRLHNGSNGSEEQVELTEEYIDVGEADYYEPANAQRSSGYPQHLRVPKNEFQPQSSSSTYYVQRMPIQTQFIAPAVNPDFSHQMEIKSTLLRPASTYSRPSTVLNTRMPGLPNSILPGSLNSGKPKPKKGQGNKKHCNCTKSLCLKLYCDCFANGEFCLDCNCKDCHNNLSYENERSRAIKSSLERNPNAFKPKIGVSSKNATKAVGVDMVRLHRKGCHCKKSNCLKNYCECYEAKVPCTEQCKCVSCRNTEDDRSVRFKDKFNASTLAQLAAAAVNNNRDGSPESDEDDGIQEEPDPKTQPWFYMTDDVIEATTMCMVSYAQEMENKADGKEPVLEELERGLLHEFSRCIGQIVESAKVAPGKNRP